MDVKGIQVAVLDKYSDPPSPPFFSDQKDNADPLFQILHTSPAQITSRQRGRPRKGVSPKVSEKTITCLYAEVLNEIDASNGPLCDTLEQISSRLGPLKNVKISLTLDELANITPHIFNSIHNYLQKIETQADIFVATTEKLLNNKIECVYIHVKVNNRPVTAIVDTGAPDVIMSTKLACAMKIAPDIKNNQTFGTAGPSLTQA